MTTQAGKSSPMGSDHPDRGVTKHNRRSFATLKMTARRGFCGGSISANADVSKNNRRCFVPVSMTGRQHQAVECPLPFPNRDSNHPREAQAPGANRINSKVQRQEQSSNRKLT